MFECAHTKITYEKLYKEVLTSSSHQLLLNIELHL